MRLDIWKRTDSVQRESGKENDERADFNVEEQASLDSDRTRR